MIALRVIALASVAVAFGPPAGPGPQQFSGTGCALIIPSFQGQDICVTYEAVNSAFTQARDRVGLPPVTGKFDTDAVGRLGTVVHEASRILAGQYGLSKDAIANGLPLIDTTKV